MPTYTLEQFKALESAIWDALVAGDAAKDAEMLEDGFLGVYSTGFENKAGHTAQLRDGPSIRQYELSDARIVELAEHVVLFAYRADFSRCNGLASTPDEHMYVSSVWRLGPQGWRNIFSQDTECLAAVSSVSDSTGQRGGKR